MTHEELLAKIDSVGHSVEYGHGIEISRIVKQLSALRAVVELLKEFSEDEMLEQYKNSYLLLAFQEAIEEQLK